MLLVLWLMVRVVRSAWGVMQPKELPGKGYALEDIMALHFKDEAAFRMWQLQMQADPRVQAALAGDGPSRPVQAVQAEKPLQGGGKDGRLQAFTPLRQAEHRPSQAGTLWHGSEQLWSAPSPVPASSRAPWWAWVLLMQGVVGLLLLLAVFGALQ